MKMQYVYEHIARLLRTNVKVYKLAGDEEYQLIDTYTADMFSSIVPEEMEAQLLGFGRTTVPQIVSIGHTPYYGIVVQQDEITLIGPVRLSAPMSLRHTVSSEYDISNAEPPWIPCDIPLFLNGLLLLHNVTHEISVTEQEVLASSCAFEPIDEVQKYYTKLVFQNRENGNHHNSYQQELRMLDSIEKGNPRLLENSQQEVFYDDLGKLAPDMDRNVRNICISVITLASRAAIRGGIHPELAFSLCDAYIMKIEELKNITDVQVLVEGAEAHFAKMVQALHRSPEPEKEQLRHPLVEKSKDYIYANLHDKIVLNDVAALVGTNPCYLSELFKRYEGISFSDFVFREKVDLAKNLLLYSSASYGEIAANLGFSSQSHLGKQFKKLTGMTLMQFRNQFASTTPEQ